MTDQLAAHEARAQQGIIEFAEEMKIIRDENLYPNAGETNSGKIEPWNTYCKERWGTSRSAVDKAVQALPVLRRRSARGARLAVQSAAIVASLPEAVQDAILDSADGDMVREQAKAARKEAKRIRDLGREPTDQELIAAAMAAKPKKVKKPKHKSKFTSLLAQAAAFLEDAADYASTETLTDIENEFAWSRLEKIDLQKDRIRERVYQPDHVRNWDEEAAVLLGE